MANFMCHLDWVTGYTDIWLDIIQGVCEDCCWMRWTFQISEWSKQTALPSVGRPYPTCWRFWIEHFLRKGRIYFLSWDVVFCPQIRLKLRPPAPWLFPACKSWDFWVSIIKWGNFLISCLFITVFKCISTWASLMDLSLVLLFWRTLRTPKRIFHTIANC